MYIYIYICNYCTYPNIPPTGDGPAIASRPAECRASAPSGYIVHIVYMYMHTYSHIHCYIIVIGIYTYTHNTFYVY